MKKEHERDDEKKIRLNKDWKSNWLETKSNINNK